jgi:hypothetical protein
VAVFVLWELRTPLPAPVAFEVAMSARGAVPRPPHALRVDLGSRASRRFLGTGFGPDETTHGRTTVRMIGETSRLIFTFAPDPVGTILHVAVQNSTNDGREVGVRLNGNDAGALHVGSGWTFSSLRLLERHFLGGANEIELSRGAGLVVDWLSLEPESAVVDLDLRSSAARAVLGSGFTIEETLSRPPVVRLGENSRARFRLRPAPADYVLGLVGRADPGSGPLPIQIFVNGVGVGVARLPMAGGSGTVSISRERVVSGENQLEATRPKERGATLERLLLEPISEATFLDVGSPRGRAYLAGGFAEDETVESTTCTWSDGRASQISLFVQPTGASYRLTLRAHAFSPVAPVVVTARMNGRPVGSVEVAADFGVHQLVLPAETLRSGANELELSYSRRGQPISTLVGSNDSREPSVRYDWLELSPLAR